MTYHQQKGVVMVMFFLNFAISRDAVRRAGLSAELLVKVSIW